MPIQQWSEEIWILSPGDDPAFSDEVDGARSSVMHHEPPPSVIVDLNGTHHLNSSNLSQLLRLRKACVDRGTHLRIAAPNDACWSLFLTTGLDKVFTFSRDTTTALAEMQIGEST